MKDTNHSILYGIAHGKDREVLDLLNTHLLPKIRKYILSNRGAMDDVKDVFQEIVFMIYRKVKMENFEPQGDLVNYMFVSAKNAWVGRATKSQRNNDIENYAETMESDEKSSLNQMMSDERNNAAIEILQTLGTQCRELLNLRIYEEMDLPEIATQLGMTNTDVVKSTIYRCKKKLKDKIIKNKGFMNLLGIQI